MPRELLTAKQVAELFEVTPHTIYNWVDSGRLERIETPSGGVRFVREDIERLLTPALKRKEAAS